MAAKPNILVIWGDDRPERPAHRALEGRDSSRPDGMNEKIVTIAALLKNEGCDLNHMLPTNHGFDEFYGNLNHLNAEEELEMYDCEPLRLAV